MSGRKIVLDDDSPSDLDNLAKTRKEEEQRLRVAEPFDIIDDIASGLRSIEAYVASEKAGAFREILEKMERWKQAQDVDLELERILYMEYLKKMRWLVNDYLGNVSKVKFEDLLEEMESDERLFRGQTNYRENFNCESEVVEWPQLLEPLQQNIFFSQANEKLSETSEQLEEEEAIDSNPVQNLLAGDNEFMSFSVRTDEPPQHVNPVTMATAVVRATAVRKRRSPSEVGMYTTDESDYAESIVSVEDSSVYSDTDSISTLCDDADDILRAHDSLQPEQHPPQFSNRIKNLAEINFNAALLEKLMYCKSKGIGTGVDGLCDMIKQRAAQIEKPQYEHNLADQQLFHQGLLTKLRGFEQELADRARAAFTEDPRWSQMFHNDVKIVCQRVVYMLQSDALSRGQCFFPFFRYLSDSDLLKCIVNKTSDSVAAQYILRERKLQLRSLSFEWKLGTMKLELRGELGNSSIGIEYYEHRKFEYAMKVNAAYLFKIILNCYDFSLASIILRNDGSNSGAVDYNMLVRTFGSPPTDQNLRTRIQFITLDSPGKKDLLRWFCPRQVSIMCDSDSEALRNEPSLISGVDSINIKKIVADRVMENLMVGQIHIDGKVVWSDDSIIRVLTKHRLSGSNGRPRVICHKRRQQDSVVKNVVEFKQFFDTWSRTFEAEHGKIGRKVTLKDDRHWITLTLH